MDSGLVEQKSDVEQNFQSIFRPGLRITKIKIDADLAPGSLNSIIEQYVSELREKPNMLLVNTKDLSRAKEVVAELGRPFSQPPGIKHEMIIVPVSFFRDWAWAIAGNKGVFWSPGA